MDYPYYSDSPFFVWQVIGKSASCVNSFYLLSKEYQQINYLIHTYFLRKY